MIIVDKETLETCDAEDLRNEYRHIMFDFTDPEIVGEVLESIGKAVLNMPSQPVFDSRYYDIEPVNVTEQNGIYSGEWLTTLKSDLDIAQVEEEKRTEIAKEAEKAIVAGFYSDALGSPHFYVCDITAQLNIQGNALQAVAGRDVEHICIDSNGVRAKRSHTAAQMIAVGDALSAHIWMSLDRANALYGDIAAHGENADIESLLAVRW